MFKFRQGCMDTAAMQRHRCVRRKGTVFMSESLDVGHLFGTEIAVAVVWRQLDVGMVSYF